MSRSAALSSLRKFYRGFGIADALSISRGLAAVPVVLLGLRGHLPAATICFIIGQATDPFDGMLARKRGALQDTFPNLDLDGINDAILGFAATALIGWLIATNHDTPLVIGLVIGIWVATALLGSYMAFVSMNAPVPSRLDRMVIRINMLVAHAGIQIGGATLWFVYMSFDRWVFWLTAVVLGVICALNAHKVVLWWHGKIK
jgi:phosphatidylglycerophosphate synthase